MQNGANGELAVPMYALTYVKPIKRIIQTLFSYQKHLLGNPFRRLFLPVFIRCRHGRVAQKYIKSIAKSAKNVIRQWDIALKAALPHSQSGTSASSKRHFRIPKAALPQCNIDSMACVFLCDSSWRSLLCLRNMAFRVFRGPGHTRVLDASCSGRTAIGANRLCGRGNSLIKTY